jgi:hypothetical protein
MAAAQNTNQASSDKYHQNESDLSPPECQKCELMLKRLHSALEELESSKLALELLQQDIADKLNETNGSSKTIYPVNGTNTKMNSKRPEQGKWLVTTTKCYKKNSLIKNPTAKISAHTLPIANRYELLNLQKMEEETTKGRENQANIMSSAHQTSSTTTKGKIDNINRKVWFNKRNQNNNIKVKKFAQHKVEMFGDSFLRGSRENVDLSLSSKISLHSLVKPGCKLNCLIKSTSNTVRKLTQKDAIVICGGSNDLNQDDPSISDLSQNKVKSAISSIRKFIENSNHTNIIIVNVPNRYDLPYQSPTNVGIRSYNAELMELSSKYDQVTIIESGLKRKFHTRHGLHFNRQGKLVFSNKMAQVIHMTLGKRNEHKTEPKNKSANHELEKQRVPIDDNETMDEEGKNSSSSKGDLVSTQPPQSDNKISESVPVLQKQDTINCDSVSISEIEKCNQGKCNQIADEGIKRKAPETVDEGWTDTSDRGKQEIINSNINENNTTEPRTSGRVRKQPVTRGDDFLWAEDQRQLTHH